MKRFVLFILLLPCCFISSNAATITWTGNATSNWQNAGNWFPNMVPSTNDDVVFNSSATVYMDVFTMMNTRTINSLTITNGANVELRFTLSSGGGKTLQVKSTSATTLGLKIDAGCVLLFHGTNSGGGTFNYILDLCGAAGVTGEISGELHFSGAGSAGTADSTRLRVYSGVSTYANLVVKSGGLIKYLPLSGNTKSAPGAYLTMENNSVYEIAKDNGFFPQATWQPNSIARASSPGTTAPGFVDGMTYGNLEWNCPSQNDNDLNVSVTFNNVHLIATNSFYFRITGASGGAHVMTINGNLDIDGGSYIDIVGALAAAGSSGKIILKGHLNNSGLINTNGIAGTINQFELGGSSNQNITNNGFIQGVRLELIMNGDSATLLTPIILPGDNNAAGANLQLLNGKIITTAANYIRLNDNATVSGGSTNSFISGPMKKIGDDDFIFPVGLGSIYAPIGITNVSGQATGDAFTAEYKRANPQSTVPYGPAVAGGMNHVSYVEYWTLTKSTGAPISKMVSLYVHPLSFCKVLANTYVSHWNGSVWTNEGSSIIGGTSTAGMYQAGTIRSTSSISNFTSPNNNAFTLITDLSPTNNPLPINLITFDAARLTNTKSSINWELAMTCSSAVKFEIERANADKSFSKIAVVSGSETNKLYNYIDKGLKNGINYYRLKMIDEDRTITYSRTVAVMNGVNGLLLTSLMPTVVTNASALTIASSKRQKLDLIIIDMQGRAVLKGNYTIVNGNTNIELQLSGLAAGVYQLTGISDEGSANTIRFIKQ